MTYYGVCQVCHNPVRSPEKPAFQVMGFEVPRDQGGTNHIHNRQRVPNRVWHASCLPAEHAGGVQERLV